MPRLRVVGLRLGLQKVSLTEAFRRELRLGLNEAKEMTDAVLDSVPVGSEMPSAERAETFETELAGLGCVVETMHPPVP